MDDLTDRPYTPILYNKFLEAVTLLQESQQILRSHYCYTVDDGEYTEDFNDDAVIEMDNKIGAWLEALKVSSE